MNKIKGPAGRVLSTFFASKTTCSLGSALKLRRPPLPLHHRAGSRTAAFFSTFPSSSSTSTTTASKTLLAAASAAAHQDRRVQPLKGPRRRQVHPVRHFSVGGYDWCIQYYPAGVADYSDDVSYDRAPDAGDEDEEEGDDEERYVSVFLALVSKDAPQVRANCSLKLVDPATGVSVVCPSMMKRTRVFNGAGSTWGFGKFKNWSELESSGYLKDDCLKIQCDVSIVTGTSVSESEPVSSDQYVLSESDE
ncbi:hypothetical protein HU200_041706 [Digitaria exilis]|uniref:MATH domain-containing protein n=1 Tax=Digitaria exilis TaxID=1010633 RepID=A0A835EHR0_9POAL|nr:hypothetical protein HU200_041706 [Digitaria exilis]